MPPALRLVLCVENTARISSAWRHGLRRVVDALLAAAEGVQGGCELAVVLFGAAPPHSAAPVESTVGWLTSVADFRQHLLDDGPEFAGGGNQPVALAAALAEAAALFASAGGGGGAARQQHCLVCFASDPDSQPVPWPYAEDCSVAKLPGLATSAELCRAFWRRGIRLGLVGPNLMGSSLQFWMLASLVFDMPLSFAEAQWNRLRQQAGGESLQAQLARALVSLPSGGGFAALPHWPQGLEALQQKVGAKPFAQPSAGGGKGLGAPASQALPAADSLEVLPPADAEQPEAKRARLAGTAPPAAAAVVPPAQSAAAGVPGPAQQALSPFAPSPEQPGNAPWAPSPGGAGLQRATPQTAPSPGSFWEVLNAEILSPNEADMGMPMAAQQQQGQLPSPAGFAPAGEPAVPGLPLPPMAQQQQQMGHNQQHQQQQMAGPGQPGGGAAGKLFLLHTAQVSVDSKVNNGNYLLLGTAQVWCLQQDAGAFAGMAWPPELRVAKTLSIAQARQTLTRPGCKRTRLSLKYASAEAQAFPEMLLRSSAVGVVALSQSAAGILVPSMPSSTRQISLQLVVVPQARS